MNTEKREFQNLTELVFILDRSGSMSGLERDTIGGFNGMIEKQKKLDGDCLVSTVLFDHEQTVLHDRIDLKAVAPMTDSDYCVRGSTALLDAVGGAIHHIGNIHKYIRKEDVPSKTIFVITTDGMENASHLYSVGQVRSMIERQKAEYGWEFIFLGANIDAVESAGRIGISPACSVNYYADPQGTACVYEGISENIANARAGRPRSRKWRQHLDADFESRKP
ncbi:MAG: VWA domain-containing protein [Clostridia bacterium]|nr:VWA domain-containing protein [Clostridia bacterium]